MPCTLPAACAALVLVMKVEAHTLGAASAVWRTLESHLAHSRHREERKVDLGKGRTRILNITFIRNVYSRMIQMLEDDL